VRKSAQQVVTLALDILDSAAYRSNTEKVDTIEVRLALAALWCILKDRRPLLDYWHHATNLSPHPWVNCRESHYGIKTALRREGWHAPVRNPPRS